jgi:hypothetical protein
LTNDNQKTSNIKDKFDINSKAYSPGGSINKGYDNYMEELINKKSINCKSYNYGFLGSSVGVIINNSSDADKLKEK